MMNEYGYTMELNTKISVEMIKIKVEQGTVQLDND